MALKFTTIKPHKSAPVQNLVIPSYCFNFLIITFCYRPQNSWILTKSILFSEVPTGVLMQFYSNKSLEKPWVPFQYKDHFSSYRGSPLLRPDGRENSLSYQDNSYLYDPRLVYIPYENNPVVTTFSTDKPSIRWRAAIFIKLLTKYTP